MELGVLDIVSVGNENDSDKFVFYTILYTVSLFCNVIASNDIANSKFFWERFCSGREHCNNYFSASYNACDF